MTYQQSESANSPSQELIDAGSGLVGSVGGSVVGLLLGGPDGAVAGAAAGPVAASSLRYGLNELGRRLLGPREKVRVGAAAIYAAQRLENVLAAGATIRSDGFFDDLPDGRNAGREVAEGVLLKARMAYQERKVRHIGAMFANVAIYPEIDDATAALTLERAERLTWRQYVLLAAVGRAEQLPLPALTVGQGSPGDWGSWGARRELQELYEAGYFTSPTRKTEKFNIRVPNLELGQQRLGTAGRLVHDLLSLDEVAETDVLASHAELRGNV